MSMVKWGWLNSDSDQVNGPFLSRATAEEDAQSALGYQGDTADIVQIVTVARMVLKPAIEEVRAPVPTPDSIELITVEEEDA
ncbi:hypothetical protein V5F49_11120 [Xanthobacter sp. V3C-3]|uniref:hypothetical protein n=1 Tax=Xanthobacter lutulentifluminis TaxID=3119935 RepID=UPI0037299271